MSHGDDLLRMHRLMEEVHILVRPVIESTLDAELLQNMCDGKAIFVVLPLRKELVEVGTGLKGAMCCQS